MDTVAANSWDPARRIITSIPISHPSQTSISTSAIGIMPGSWGGCASLQMKHGEKIKVDLLTWWWQDIGIKLSTNHVVCQVVKKNHTGVNIYAWEITWCHRTRFWGADHHVASSSPSSHGTCHWRRPFLGENTRGGKNHLLWQKMFDKKRNEVGKDKLFDKTRTFFVNFRSRLQTLIFRLKSLAFPRFTAHWLPLEQLCGHQSLPTT